MRALLIFLLLCATSAYGAITGGPGSGRGVFGTATNITNIPLVLSPASPTNFAPQGLVLTPGGGTIVFSTNNATNLVLTVVGGVATNAQPPSANLTNWSTLATNVLDLYVNRNAGTGTNITLTATTKLLNSGTNNILYWMTNSVIAGAINSNGWMVIGDDIPESALHVHGNITAADDVTAEFLSIGGTNITFSDEVNFVKTGGGILEISGTRIAFTATPVNISAALTATNVTITNRVISGLKALSYSGTNVTVDWSQANHFYLLATNSFKLWFTNGPGANWSQTGLIDIRQDGTGGRLMYWDSTNIETNSTGLVLSTAADAKDKLYVATDHTGTNFQCLLNLNFQK